jgi:hypothetical protein
MKISQSIAVPGLLLAIAMSFSSCGLSGSPSSGQTQEATMPSSSSTDVSPTPELPVLGIAPELTNEVWLNTDSPLRLADLKGKVVLIEFWTFG